MGHSSAYLFAARRDIEIQSKKTVRAVAASWEGFGLVKGAL